MLNAELLQDKGVLVLAPNGPLAASDFAAAAALADPYIERHGSLRGLLIDVKSFPGWENFAGLTAHLKFVRGHQAHIRRIALVSDSAMATIGPALARHFVAAKIETFKSGEQNAALAWLGSD
jgi:hypothetical protein